MTINELIEKAHSAAKEKGFWDKERNTGELLMLIVSECGEALEAHRSGKRADLAKFDAMLGAPAEEERRSWDSFFKENIKDTFEDELADIVIRIADWMGYKGWTNGTMKDVIDIHHNLGDNLWRFNKRIARNGDDLGESEQTARDAMAILWALSVKYGVDLWRHIELKLAYNATRPKLHGKAY